MSTAEARAQRRCVWAWGRLAVLMLCVHAGDAWAGPWIRESGHAYAKLGMSWFRAPEAFVRGVSVDAPKVSFDSVTTQLYAEVGLPGALQLIVDAPFVYASQGRPGAVRVPNVGLGDVRLEVDRGLLASIPLSAGVEVKLPAYQTIGARARGGEIVLNGRAYAAESIPDVGDGNVDVTPKLMAGRGFQFLGSWVSAELGYRLRLGSFSDGVSLAATAGAWVLPNHVALGAYVYGIKNVEAPANVWPTREYLYANAYVLSTGLPAMPKLSLIIGAGTTLLVSNASRGFDVSVGVGYER